MNVGMYKGAVQGAGERIQEEVKWDMVDLSGCASVGTIVIRSFLRAGWSY